jgi:hypothetical protein
VLRLSVILSSLFLCLSRMVGVECDIHTQRIHAHFSLQPCPAASTNISTRKRPASEPSEESWRGPQCGDVRVGCRLIACRLTPVSGVCVGPRLALPPAGAATGEGWMRLVLQEGS